MKNHKKQYLYGNQKVHIRMKEFKKYIQSKNKEELKLELEDLFSNFEMVREHYSTKFKTNSGVVDKEIKLNLKTITGYKKKIKTALFPDENFEGGFNIDKIENILSKLKRRSNLNYYLEIGCFATEESTKLSNLYGGDYGEEYYVFFAELYEKICLEVIKSNLINEYIELLRRLKDEAFEGYDYKYVLGEIFNEQFK